MAPSHPVTARSFALAHIDPDTYESQNKFDPRLLRSSIKLTLFRRVRAQSNLGWKTDLSLGREWEKLFSTLDFE